MAQKILNLVYWIIKFDLWRRRKFIYLLWGGGGGAAAAAAASTSFPIYTTGNMISNKRYQREVTVRASGACRHRSAIYLENYMKFTGHYYLRLRRE